MKFDRFDHEGPLARSAIVRIAYLGAMLIRYAINRLSKDTYAAHQTALHYERIASSMRWPVLPFLAQINARLIETLKREAPRNVLVEAYLNSPARDPGRDAFKSYNWDYQVRLKHPRTPEDAARQGNLLLLKPPRGDREKGVLLIKYTYAFQNFVSLFDLPRVAQRFRMVLEPSYWGYRDANFLFFIGMGTDVIVQAPYAPDHDYIASLGSNLIPIRVGAGDWVDPDFFQAGTGDAKTYDIVMVASWLPLKRHSLLFSAMRHCGGRLGRVALVGYPIEGKTQADIRAGAQRYGVDSQLDIFESVPREKAAEIMRRSKIGVMLSLREGANKGLYECFFSGVPMIVSNGNIGVNRAHINSATGVLASDRELPDAILHLLNPPHALDPRGWALRNTGYKNATAELNHTLKTRALAAGEPWTQDIYFKKNEPNAQYAHEHERLGAVPAIAQLKSFLR